MRKGFRGASMILAFDIGASRIKAAREGLGLGAVATPLTDFAAFVAALRGFVRGDEHGVAIAMAGVIDSECGRIKVANIPCVDGRAVAADLQAALSVPVLVLNDADCFALAEIATGAARGHRNVFALILGSGVGGGLVIDGKVVQGAGGYSGEWGHGPVIRDPAFPCGCGQVGCLDTVGSARGLERLHHHLTGKSATSITILELWHDGQQSQTIDLWLDLVSGHVHIEAGLRFDTFTFDVNGFEYTDVNRTLVGKQSATKLQPKLTILVSPFDRFPISFYANYGNSIFV